MGNKIYKLRKGCKKFSASPENLGPLRSLELRFNKRRVQKILKARKRFKRLNPWLHLLRLLAFYFGLVGFMVLLSRLGR
jgi:hypothetical protein